MNRRDCLKSSVVLLAGAVSGATEYHVYRSTTSGGPYTLVAPRSPSNGFSTSVAATSRPPTFTAQGPPGPS